MRSASGLPGAASTADFRLRRPSAPPLPPALLPSSAGLRAESGVNAFRLSRPAPAPPGVATAGSRAAARAAPFPTISGVFAAGSAKLAAFLPALPTLRVPLLAKPSRGWASSSEPCAMRHKLNDAKS
jgi:hypothetical protein